jgi:single-strand DNA-binding protein
MSFSVNTISQSGRIGKDATVHETKDNAGFISFSLAVADDRKNQDGTWTKQTIWVPVSWYTYGINHKAEALTKGQSVLVSGKLKQDEWTKDGVKQTRLVLAASEVAILINAERKTADRQDTPASSPLPPSKAESNPDDENLPF